MIGVSAGKNLSLSFQPPKSAGMNHPVAVALKVVTIRMRWLGMTASARIFNAHRIVGEHEESLTAFTEASGLRTEALNREVPIASNADTPPRKTNKDLFARS
jgi:hypothetical protein